MPEHDKDNRNLTWNQRQEADARDRIRQAVVILMEKDAWSEGTMARFKSLCAKHISGSTLYRHKDLWHPDFLASTPKKI